MVAFAALAVKCWEPADAPFRRLLHRVPLEELPKQVVGNQYHLRPVLPQPVGLSLDGRPVVGLVRLVGDNGRLWATVAV